MSNQDELKQVYVQGVKNIFLEKDPETVTEAWNKLFSEDLSAESLGQTFTSSSFLTAIFDFKRNYVEVEVDFVQVLRTDRRIGIFETLRLKKENGEVEHGKAIIHAEFGQVGSKDEEKIVVIREVVEFGSAE